MAAEEAEAKSVVEEVEASDTAEAPVDAELLAAAAEPEAPVLTNPVVPTEAPVPQSAVPSTAADNNLTDIFQWANNVEAVRDLLEVELYLVDKHYGVYTAMYDAGLKRDMAAYFLKGILKDVNAGAARGMSVRDFELAEDEEGVLQHTRLPRVEHAADVIANIEEAGADIEPFSATNHEFKNIKCMIARFNHKNLKKPFYIVKLVPQSQVLKGDSAWMFSGRGFEPFSADAGLKVTPDSQVLIAGDDVFIFNQAKFEKIFNYNAKWASIAHQKVAEIEANYNLSFADGLDLQTLLKKKKSLVKKLQKIDLTEIKQDALVDHSDELGLELMLDDLGAIIIMDAKDLDKFVNLLNDDYVSSKLTGKVYEAKSKKPLNEEKPQKLPAPKE
ncbi:DUF4868 domain-containing protein [Candidatus Saccharibacteria bacterium]|nr:DUF4868 domain-containing protein [Candidatus Saccharibacteria bacterium]